MPAICGRFLFGEIGMANQSRGINFNGTLMKVTKQPTTPADSITALSVDEVAVATANNTLNNGDVIYIESVHNPAINGTYIASKTSATKFNVVGLDTKVKGTATDAKFTKVDAMGICDIKNLKVNDAKVKYEDMTTNCDEYPYEVGTVESGEITADIVYDPEKDVIAYLEELKFSQFDTVFQFKLKGNKNIRSYICSVSSFEYSGQSNEKWKGSISLKVKSRPLDVAV